MKLQDVIRMNQYNYFGKPNTSRIVYNPIFWKAIHRKEVVIIHDLQNFQICLQTSESSQME